jgi:MYXO-CTERM domain-containing protein
MTRHRGDPRQPPWWLWVLLAVGLAAWCWLMFLAWVWLVRWAAGA